MQPLEEHGGSPHTGGVEQKKKKSAGSSGSMSMRGMTAHTSPRKQHGGFPPSEKAGEERGRGGGVWIISGAFLER